MSKRHRGTDDLGEEEVTHPPKKRTYLATRETKSFKPPRLPGVRAFDAKRGFRELYRRNTKTACSREQQIMELQQAFHGEKADTADVVDTADHQRELVGDLLKHEYLLRGTSAGIHAAEMCDLQFCEKTDSGEYVLLVNTTNVSPITSTTTNHLGDIQVSPIIEQRANFENSPFLSGRSYNFAALSPYPISSTVLGDMLFDSQPQRLRGRRIDARWLFDGLLAFDRSQWKRVRRYHIFSDITHFWDQTPYDSSLSKPPKLHNLTEITIPDYLQSVMRTVLSAKTHFSELRPASEVTRETRALHESFIEKCMEALKHAQQLKTAGDASLMDLLLKYKIPEKLWRTGWKAYLDYLEKHGLLDQMEAFLQKAYMQIYELEMTMPDFRSFWEECRRGLDKYLSHIRDMRPMDRRGIPPLRDKEGRHKEEVDFVAAWSKPISELGQRMLSGWSFLRHAVRRFVYVKVGFIFCEVDSW